LVIHEFTALNGFRGKEQYTVNIDLPEPASIVEKRLQDYIIKSILLYRSIRFLPFVFDNKSMIEMAKHFLFHRIGSLHTFYSYTRAMHKFCKWIGKQPDSIIFYCQNNADQIGLAFIRSKIDEYIFWDRQNGYADRTIQKEIQCILSFFRINRINLDLNLKLPGRQIEVTRSITLDELHRLLEVANLREKVIIGMLAVSGLRTSSLVKLQYRHVKEDLEKGINPIHILVEPQITKGKYHGYSTFLNQEIEEWLKEYLYARRKGSRRLPPENITDESPLIRCRSRDKAKINSIQMNQLAIMFSRLCYRAGIDRTKNGTGYELTNRSFRKFFRTQMSVLGVQKDLVEYMMGHTTGTYMDIKMVGVEYLRRVYKISGISLKQKPEYDRFLLLKQTIERLEFNPEEILKPEILDRLGIEQNSGT
jgi:integrase